MGKTRTTPSDRAVRRTNSMAAALSAAGSGVGDAGLGEVGVDIDEAGADDEPGGVDDLRRVLAGAGADGGDAPVHDEHVGDGVQLIRRIDDSAAADRKGGGHE